MLSCYIKTGHYSLIYIFFSSTIAIILLINFKELSHRQNCIVSGSRVTLWRRNYYFF